ncbi:MAG: hypothetical protein V4507_05700 [Verrucomicrobiota bacterium]
MVLWRHWMQGLLRVVLLGLALVAAPVEAESSTDRSLKQESETDRIERLERQLKATQESLMLSNSEVQVLRKAYEELQLKNEALGVDALTADEKRLQDRVVQAVKEVYQAEKARREAAELLEKWVNNTQSLLKTAQGLDPQKRSEYEAILRSTREYLEGRGAARFSIGRDLKDGQILDINKDLDSVILNIGQKQEVKVGMPFRVFRDNLLVGRIKILQVREHVSVALIERVEKGNELKTGDRVSVAADK